MQDNFYHYYLLTEREARVRTPKIMKVRTKHKLHLPKVRINFSKRYNSQVCCTK